MANNKSRLLHQRQLINDMKTNDMSAKANEHKADGQITRRLSVDDLSFPFLIGFVSCRWIFSPISIWSPLILLCRHNGNEHHFQLLNRLCRVDNEH